MQVTQAFIQHGGNGVGSTRPMLTEEVAYQQREAPRSGQTRTGYGSKLPTDHMVHFEGRWRRVYAICFSNCATLYILDRDNSKLIVSLYE